MKLFFLSLGSNMGDREAIMKQAVALMGERLGEVVACSSFYQTVAQGYASDNLFMNAVVALRSDLSPHALLAATQQIEHDLGCDRHRNDDGTYCDRLLDIDMVACEDMVCNDALLILPHPRMHERLFVLDPLCEITSEWKHPLLQLTANEMRLALAISQKE